MADFPVVATHNDVECWAVKDDGVRHEMQRDVRDDYGPGQGRYSQGCSCGFRTWYDLDAELFYRPDKRGST